MRQHQCFSLGQRMKLPFPVKTNKLVSVMMQMRYYSGSSRELVSTNSIITQTKRRRISGSSKATSPVWFLLLPVAAFLKRVGRCKRLLMETGHRGRQTFHLVPVLFLCHYGNRLPATKEIETGRFVEFLALPKP